MAVAQVLSMVAILAISVAIGFVAFYLTSDLSKVHKKQWITEMLSQLINFVIFIWLGKIVWHFDLFIQDPLAILAYPSNAQAFYLAVLFIVLTLAYKQFRGKLDIHAFMYVCIPVFLVASFVYEFIQFVWENHTSAIGYLALLALLLIVFVFIRDRLNHSAVTIVMMMGWTAGVLLLTLIQPLTTVFGYIMVPWFAGVLFVASILLLIINRRKKVS